MSQQVTPKPSEKQIQNKFFQEILPKRYSGALITKNWKGWSYRGRDRRITTNFYREFDIAMFERKIQGSIRTLVLTGFEVKGFKRSGKPPSFAEGLEQAVVLLQQGADFAYLIHPEPDKDDKKALKELCDRFAPFVGLIFVPHELGKLSPSYLPVDRSPRQNPYSSRDRKRDMLTSLITSGHRSQITSDTGDLPLWCKKQEY